MRSKRGALLLAAALTGCRGLDCLPASATSEREAFRHQLRGLVHLSQCPGLPTPKALGPRAFELHQREQALLGRVRSSRLKEDLDRAIREDEEYSRNVFEADCAVHSEEFAETPRGREMFEAGLRAEEERLRGIEQRFQNLIAKCG